MQQLASSEPEQKAHFCLVCWNIQELQVYETVTAICAPAFSPAIMAEYKANIRTDMCERSVKIDSPVYSVLQISISPE